MVKLIWPITFHAVFIAYRVDVDNGIEAGSSHLYESQSGLPNSAEPPLTLSSETKHEISCSLPTVFSPANLERPVMEVLPPLI